MRELGHKVSFFRRIARHGISGRDPREDRLTEICAAVFAAEAGQAVASHVVEGWLDVVADQTVSQAPLAALQARCALQRISDAPARLPVRVQTQLQVLSGGRHRRPDLELVLGDDSSPRGALRVWVEAKHGTSPHSDQLQAYLDSLHEMAAREAVVLLVAPRSDLLRFEPTQIPDAVGKVSWECTSSLLATFSSSDPVSMFLAQGLHDYLREEGLVDPESLTDHQLAAFPAYQEGRRALVRMSEIAAEKVAQLWAPGTPYMYPDRGIVSNYFWSYPGTSLSRTVIALPADADLQWQLLFDATDALLDEQPGVPIFMAGIVLPARTVGTVFTTAQLEAAADRGIQTLAVPLQAHGWDYLAAAAHPTEIDGLIEAPSIDAQADRLATWIHQTFATLAAILD